MIAIVGGFLLSFFGVGLAFAWNSWAKRQSPIVRPPGPPDIAAAVVSVASICGGGAIILTKVVVEIGKAIIW